MWFCYAIANNSFVARTADGWDGVDPLHLQQIGVADVENGACGEAPPTLGDNHQREDNSSGLEVAPWFERERLIARPTRGPIRGSARMTDLTWRRRSLRSLAASAS
jgi:hypothetical protein